MIRTTRRSFLKSTAAFSIAGATAMVGQARAADAEIVWGTNEAYGRPDFLEPFETASGTVVRTELFSDPAEVVTKLKTGGAGVHMLVDGSYHVEISHAEGVLQPIELSNVPNWDRLVPEFKTADGLTFDGKPYGVPFAWGTDSMIYRHEDVGQDLDDLAVLFDPEFAGRISMPNGLFESLVVGAMYLGIEKPYSMSKDELDAVVDLLIKQKPLVRTYWNDIGDLKNLMATGEVAVAWGWQPVMEIRRDGIDVRWAHPKQGELGWYDATYLTIEATDEAKAAAEAFMSYLIGDTYGMLLGQEVGYRTTSLAAIENMTPDLRSELEIENPSAFLERATWFLSPSDPAAYQAAWDRVLNA